MRPLDRITSIKFKIGLVIVAAIATTVFTHWVGPWVGLNLLESGIAATVVALVMVNFLARGLTSPLRAMAAAATAMARGDYDGRVTTTSRDEVGELARAFNRMASELAEVDRVRRDLVANVSHELRTPISALQAVLENLVDGVETPDPEVVKTMLIQVERLGRLVAQLLDLSRLESGVMLLQRRPFEVEPLLEQAVREAGLEVGANAERSVGFEVTVEPAGLEVQGDPERVHQVVTNLLSNAVRHSPPGGRVGVRASGRSGSVMIEVEDDGPGISDEEAERVFERFYRADAARSSSEGGTGLGLAIARWIVDLHGGDIRAERGRPHGCRVVVELPAVAR